MLSVQLTPVVTDQAASLFDSCREREFELDGGEFAEAALTATVVVGVLDPDDNRVGELGARWPAPTVEHIVLQK